MTTTLRIPKGSCLLALESLREIKLPISVEPIEICNCDMTMRIDYKPGLLSVALMVVVILQCGEELREEAQSAVIAQILISEIHELQQ